MAVALISQAAAVEEDLEGCGGGDGGAASWRWSHWLRTPREGGRERRCLSICMAVSFICATGCRIDAIALQGDAKCGARAVRGRYGAWRKARAERRALGRELSAGHRGAVYSTQFRQLGPSRVPNMEMKDLTSAWSGSVIDGLGIAPSCSTRELAFSARAPARYAIYTGDARAADCEARTDDCSTRVPARSEMNSGVARKAVCSDRMLARSAT